MSRYDLLIDTSIFGAAVGLGRAGASGLLYCEVTDEVQNSARRLPLMVEDALRELKISRAEIDRVVVSQGPGSFTGIRVGIAYAYGFMKGLCGSENPGVQMAGVSSLEALAVHLSSKFSRDITLFLPSTKTTGFAAEVIGGQASLMAIDLSKDLLGTSVSKDWFVLGDWQGLRDVAGRFGGQSLGALDLRENARLALVAINDRLSADMKIKWSDEMPPAIYLRKSTVEEKAAASDQV